MTGVCRSDISMMNGDFQLLPEEMHGHEGLGIVAEIGSNVTDVQVGDYVATRGEPAYADMYRARANTYVKVPELDPKYIIEPVACGINVIMNSFSEIKRRPHAKVCILGSGFLARVAFQTLNYFPDLVIDRIDVVGRSNANFWGVLKAAPDSDTEYDIIIDLSEKPTLMNVSLKENGLIIMAAEKADNVSTNFGQWLWKNAVMHFPSPRSEHFYGCMKFAVKLIEDGTLSVDKIWTTSYNRETEWKQAFEDANSRSANYSRGYIKWD